MGTKNIIGQIVEGQDFVGRANEIKRAWELLENGNSLLLAAPRRVGKSSFSKKMIEKAKENGWSIVDINLEGKKTEVDFIKAFVSQLKKEKWYEKKSKDGISRNELQKLIRNKIKNEEKPADILSQLLSRLINDGYIMVNGENKYLFRSPLLRDFWYNRFIR